jgi:hypothetical protein
VELPAPELLAPCAPPLLEPLPPELLALLAPCEPPELEPLEVELPPPELLAPCEPLLLELLPPFAPPLEEPPLVESSAVPSAPPVDVSSWTLPSRLAFCAGEELLPQPAIANETAHDTGSNRAIQFVFLMVSQVSLSGELALARAHSRSARRGPRRHMVAGNGLVQESFSPLEV